MDMNHLVDEIDIRQRVMERPYHVKAAFEWWLGMVPEEELNKISVVSSEYIFPTPLETYKSIIEIVEVSDIEQRSKKYDLLHPELKGVIANTVEFYENELD